MSGEKSTFATAMDCITAQLEAIRADRLKMQTQQEQNYFLRQRC